MKRIAIALLFVLIAAGAQAATIFDIQNGMYADLSIVDLTGVTVTAVRYNGVYVAEAPYSAYNGIWLYGPVGFVEGDVIDVVGGLYKEYYDLSEIETGAAVVTLTGTGPVVAPFMVDYATLLLDPEPFESCLITITDGMMVDTIGSYGQWTAMTLDGDVVNFDDYFFDETTVVLGDCYNSVTGIWDYSYSMWKMNPLADTGVELTDCTVATDAISFEGVKALYR